MRSPIASRRAKDPQILLRGLQTRASIVGSLLRIVTTLIRPNVFPGPPAPVTVTPVQADQGLTDRPSRNTTAVRCAGCRREFQPTRKDTKFCSAACKQRAYRLGKVVEAQQLALEGAFGVTQTLAAQAAPAGLAY